MKKLYLIRHAKSSWRDLMQGDIDRPLNKRGKSDAPFMGKRLKKYGVQPDLLISSPAKRARKTARTVAREIGYPPKKIIFADKIYFGDLDDIFGIIRNISDSDKTVILVGHNPDITMLAEALTGRQVGNIPTCGIFCIDFKIESWREAVPGNGSFVFFDYPKKHLG